MQMHVLSPRRIKVRARGYKAKPSLMRADADAEYAADITINMSDIKEPDSLPSK